MTALVSRPGLALAAMTIVLLAVRGAEQSFWAYDEGWYAQQARWILQHGDWITQHWWGDIQYDRVMGAQWLIAASFSLFGYSESAARLPSMLAALGCVLLTFAIAARCVERRTAILAAAILSATPIWMQSARLATQDVPLVFFELLGIWALLRAEDAPHRRIAWGIVAGASIGLGFMMKGFMVIPAAAALAPYMLLDHRRHRHLANPGLYAGLVVGFVPFAVWMVLSVGRFGWEPVRVMVDKLLFLSGKDFHNAGPFYYFWNVPVNAFPWPLLALPGFAIALSDSAGRFRRRWLWIGFPAVLLVELSLFSTRTWYYALQLLPFMAVAAAICLTWIADAYAKGRLRWAVISSAVLAVLGLALIAGAALLLSGVISFGLEPAWAYYLLGGVAGAGCLLPAAELVLAGRTPNARSPRRWIAGWLAGPWLAILLAYATGLWGDYGSHIKRPLRSPELADVLTGNVVDFVMPASDPDGTDADAVLLVLYTPDPGQKRPGLNDVPEGRYAWLHDETFADGAPGGELVGKVGAWNLLRVVRQDD